VISVYTLLESEQWDEIVQSFKEYDVYYLSGYVKAFQIHGDGVPLMFFYEGKNIRGINVVMKRDIALDNNFKGKLLKDKYFDFVTPYGYGGWLIEGEGDKVLLFKEYTAWCYKNNIVSEFVRFHPILKNHNYSASDYNVISLGETVALDLTSEEIIWSNITSKNRNMIRKAEKSGIRIISGHSEEIYEQFREIYNKTMAYDNAVDYYYFKPEFYSSIYSDLSENAQVFYAITDEGNVIASTIIIFSNGKLNYHLSGSILEYRKFAPSNLLLYKVALWGVNHGFKTFHLGGGVGSGNDNLLRFKKAFFQGDLCRFHIGRKIFNEHNYRILVNMRGELPYSEYFPIYRISEKV